MSSSSSNNTHLNSRAAQLLERIQKSTQARDRAVEQLNQTLKKDDQVEEWIEFLEDAGTRQLNQTKEHAAHMANRVSNASRQAEESSRKVKELHMVSGRVQSALTLVRNVIQQRESVQNVNKALERRDFEAAGLCIKRYDEVMLSLRGTDLADFRPPPVDIAAVAPPGEGYGRKIREDGSSPATTTTSPARDVDGDISRDDTTNSFDTVDDLSTITSQAGDHDSSSVLMMDPDQVMSAARAQLEEMVRAELDNAKQTKPDVVKLTKVLADIGKKKAALDIYAQWVKDRTEAEIKELVDDELLKLTEDSNKSSHLWLVSKVLDRIAATVEKEEPHVRENFPGDGMSEVIRRLHDVCTRSCDRAIQDFLQRRKISNNASPEGKASRRGALGADPALMDDTLQDIANLITCYHLYLVFVESKLLSEGDKAESGDQKKVTTNVEEDAKQILSSSTHIHHTTTVTPASNTDWLRDPSFSKDIQHLLDIYGSQQKVYLETVFKRAYERLVAHVDSATDDGSSGGGMFSNFGGFFRREEANQTGGGPSSSDPTNQKPAEVHAINFVDDIFHILLGAVRRASQTKNCPLIKRTINDIQTLLGGDFLGTCTRRLKGYQSGGPGCGSGGSSGAERNGAVNSPASANAAATSPEATERSLRWADAGLRCSKYVSRMAEEIKNSTNATFETVEEKEQLVDPIKQLACLTEPYESAVKDALSRSAAAAGEAMVKEANLLQNFVEFNYCLGEEGLQRCDLNDPWAFSSCHLWAGMLKTYTGSLLAAENKERFIANVVENIVAHLQTLVLKKEFDQYGGLQLDKDVRTVREMFTAVADRPFRDKFIRLNQMAAILLAQGPEDAKGWYDSLPTVNKKNLTPQDVAKVLLKRADVAQEEIQRYFA